MDCYVIETLQRSGSYGTQNTFLNRPIVASGQKRWLVTKQMVWRELLLKTMPQNATPSMACGLT